MEDEIKLGDLLYIRWSFRWGRDSDYVVFFPPFIKKLIDGTEKIMGSSPIYDDNSNAVENIFKFDSVIPRLHQYEIIPQKQ